SRAQVLRGGSPEQGERRQAAGLAREATGTHPAVAFAGVPSGHLPKRKTAPRSVRTEGPYIVASQHSGGGGTRTPKRLPAPHFECGALPVRTTPPSILFSRDGRI